MDFYYLSFIMLAAVLFVLLNFTLSRLVAPHNPGGAKAFPYECGEMPADFEQKRLHLPPSWRAVWLPLSARSNRF